MLISRSTRATSASGDSEAAEGAVDAFTHAFGGGGRRWQLQEQGKDRRVAPRGRAYGLPHCRELLVPRLVIGRWRDLVEQALHDAVEEVLLALDVAVQRHRGHTEALGDGLHRERVDAPVVGDGETRPQHEWRDRSDEVGPS